MICGVVNRLFCNYKLICDLTGAAGSQCCTEVPALENQTEREGEAPGGDTRWSRCRSIFDCDERSGARRTEPLRTGTDAGGLRTLSTGSFSADRTPDGT
jgi:hypothetical protein